MEVPTGEASVICECWKAKIPLRLSLKNCGVPHHPLPVYTEIPRFAYLPFLYHGLLQSFGRAAVDQKRHTVVFEYHGITIPWHIPAGVLYDLVAEKEVPWSLEVSFVSSLPPEQLPWDDEAEGNLTPIRKHFFASLKESSYVLNGSDGSDEIVRMELETTENLWQSATKMDLPSYERILSNLHVTQMDARLKVPVRILLQKNKQLLCWRSDVFHLSRPAPSNATLLESLQEFFPFIEWVLPVDGRISTRRSVEDIGEENERAFLVCPTVSVCSIEPNLETIHLGWLHRTLHAPDNFLYLVIKPRENHAVVEPEGEG